MASKETAKTTADNGTVTGPDPFQRLRRKMAEMAILDTAESRATGEDIKAILTASEEDIWDADELAIYNAAKLSGCDIQITSFEVRFATGTNEDIETIFVDDKGRQMFLLVHSFRITDKTDRKDVLLPAVGEEFVWNTSARLIVTKLFRMLEFGWFDTNHGPVRVHIQGTPLSGGRSIEKLKEFTGTPLVTVAASVDEPTF